MDEKGQIVPIGFIIMLILLVVGIFTAGVAVIWQFALYGGVGLVLGFVGRQSIALFGGKKKAGKTPFKIWRK